MRYVQLCFKKDDFKYRNEASDFFYHKLQNELNKDNVKRKIFEFVQKIIPHSFINIISTIYIKSRR